MVMAGWIDDLREALVIEFECVCDLGAPGAVQKHKDVRERQRDLFRDVGKEGTINDILSAEKSLLAFELAHYANSKSMKGSIKDALNDLVITEMLIKTVQDTVAYKAIDDAHTRQKNRIGDLPRDEARQFFKSHWTRLLNQDKARLDLIDKKIIDARRANIRTAEKQYIALQQIALGITPEPPDKPRRAGMGV